MTDNTTFILDFGNGWTEAILLNPSESGYVYESLPTVRAQLSGNVVDFDRGSEQAFNHAIYHGKRYTLGWDALASGAKTETQQGGLRYGDEMHQFVAAYLAALMGIESGKVNLITMAPPGIYDDAKNLILDGFGANRRSKPKVTIQMWNDKAAREWQWQNVTVIPEAMAAVYALAYDDMGEAVQSDILVGDVAYIDLGALTVDYGRVQNGKFTLEGLTRITRERAGIFHNIVLPIWDQVRDHSRTFEHISAHAVDAAICNGPDADGGYYLNKGATALNIGELVEELSIEYADWLRNEIFFQQFANLEPYDRAVIVGGGAANPYIMNRLYEYYGNQIVDQSQYAHVADISPGDLNVYGAMRWYRRQYVMNPRG